MTGEGVGDFPLLEVSQQRLDCHPLGMHQFGFPALNRAGAGQDGQYGHPQLHHSLGQGTEKQDAPGCAELLHPITGTVIRNIYW